MNRLRFRSQLGQYLNEVGLTSVGVEIGVHTGQFAEKILRIWGGRKLWLVDPWCHLEDYLDSFNASDATMERRHLIARSRLNKFGDRVGCIREQSHAAVRLFRDSSLDFIYIDANHSYDHARRDLCLWYPKVKPGGVVAGHDYFDAIADDALEPWVFGCWPPKLLTSYGVKSAVDSFAKDLGVFVELTSEKFPTWYFRKPVQR